MKKVIRRARPPHVPLEELRLKSENEATWRDAERLLQAIMGGIPKSYAHVYDITTTAGAVSCKWSEYHPAGKRYSFSNVLGRDRIKPKWRYAVFMGRRVHPIDAPIELDRECWFSCVTWDDALDHLGHVRGKGALAFPARLLPGGHTSRSLRVTPIQALIRDNLCTAADLRQRALDAWARARLRRSVPSRMMGGVGGEQSAKLLHTAASPTARPLVRRILRRGARMALSRAP